MRYFHRLLKRTFPKPDGALKKKKKEEEKESEGTNQHSPSRNILGIEFMISWGILKALPNRERNIFLSGFQNARTPSYFSNIHLRLLLAMIGYAWSEQHVFLPALRIYIRECEEGGRDGFTYALYIWPQLFKELRRRFRGYPRLICVYICEELGSALFNGSSQATYFN